MNVPLMPDVRARRAAHAELPAGLGSPLEQSSRVFLDALDGFRDEFPGLIDHVKQYQGKRLRPTLLLAVAQALGGVRPAHPTLAAVVEMIHTATLIHDDVLDEAEVRRHIDAVHARAGNKSAILLGDLLFSKAFHLCATSGSAEACLWVGEATNRVVAGELLQTTRTGDLSLSEDDYYAAIGGKTAALIEVSCRLGAAHAGASAESVAQAANYGRELGLAFQIADDVLDLVGDEGRAGKTLGTDLAQGKLTLPMIFLFDRLPAPDAARLRREIAAKTVDAEAVARLLDRTGALEDARLRAEDHAARAAEELTDWLASAARDLLVRAAEWSVARQE